MDNIRVAVISLTTTADRKHNIARAVELVTQAAHQGAQWVQLPEMWAFMGSYALHYDMAEHQDGPLNTLLAALAQRLNIVLFAGSVGERPGDRERSHSAEQKIFNTSYVFARNGQIVSKYRKVHLFNLVGGPGETSHKESDGFLSGTTLQSAEIDGLKVGMSICYDLRFGEMYSSLEKTSGPLDVIVVPSAFTRLTGQVHWELLLRARAVEFQCYIYAANQVGTHSEGKESYGHGMVVDPWGAVLADTGDTPGIVLATLDKKLIKAVRKKLPALENRRADLYR